MKNKKIIKVVSLWLPVAAWMTVIFLFSSMQTKPVSHVYLTEFLIKKTAHVVEYFTLCSLYFRAFMGSGVDRKKAVIISLGLSIIYAITDEFHQSFTPGREPRVRDMLIDSSAGVLAALFLTKYLPVAPAGIQKLAKKLWFL
jgi:VanZ family protein